MNINSEIRIGTYNIGQGLGDFESMLKGSADQEQAFENIIKVICDKDNNFLEKQAEYDQLFEEQKSLCEIKNRSSDEDSALEKAKKQLRSLDTKIIAIRNLAKQKFVNENENEIAQKLVDQNLDVICLQEIVKIDRIFLKTLRANGYEMIIGPENANTGLFSTAIALRKESFDLDFQNISEATVPDDEEKDPKIYGKQIASCCATIKNTSIKISVASLHCWGFELFNPEFPHPKKSIIDSQKQAKSKKNALHYFSKAKEIMGKQENSYVWIVAGDTNHNEKNYKDTFGLMKKARYRIFSPNEPTNINAHESDYPLRKIDQFMIKTKSISLWEKIKYLITDFFVSRTVIEMTNPSKNIEATVLKGFDFTLQNNCSDHKPMMMTLSFSQKQKKAYIPRLWNMNT